MKKIIYGKKSGEENKIIFVKEEDFHGSRYYYKNTEVAVNEKKRIEKQFFNGHSFPELFAYDDVSMWWFFHQDFFFQLQKILNFIIKFHEFIEEKQPDIIKIENDFKMFDIIEQICSKKKIAFEYSKLCYLKFKLKNHLERSLRSYVRGNSLRKRAQSRIEDHVKQYKKKFNSIPSLDNKIIFASPMTYRRHIFNLDKHISEKGEYLVQDIVELIREKHDIAGISIEHTIPGHTDSVLSERLDSEMMWIPEEMLITNHDKYDQHKEFLKKYNKLISTKEFQYLFNFDGILLWKHVESVFIQMKYSPYFSYWLDLMDSLLKVFATGKPKAIFLISEIDAPALAFINAANKLKIKTIGIQQGIIQDQGPPGYLHDTYVPSKKYSYPFPDLLLIFGEFTKQVLIRNGFPSERLEIFGNPAYFNLDKMENILADKPLLQKYNVDVNQKVILFTTTKMQEAYESETHNYDTKIWRYLLENFGNDKRFFIILKPHPQENTIVYEKILKGSKSSNARIMQDSLQELLYISSVVVSNHSTVIMDAICFKKLVVEVKWDYIEDRFLQFDKAGVVLSSKIDQLNQNINEILNNTELKNTLLKNRIIFLKEQFNIPIEKSELHQKLDKILNIKS